MTTVQKNLVIVTMLAVGVVYYEADKAATLRSQVQTLQRSSGSRPLCPQ